MKQIRIRHYLLRRDDASRQKYYHDTLPKFTIDSIVLVTTESMETNHIDQKVERFDMKIDILNTNDF